MGNALNRWPSSAELQQLLRNAQSNGGEAVDALLRRVRPAVLTYFRGYVDSDTAEDLTQEALIRLARSIGRIEPERGDKYIRTIARNLLRTEYHRRGREGEGRVALDVNSLAFSTSPAEDEKLEAEELADAFRRVATELPEDLRQVLYAYLAGDSTAALADAQRVARGTVRTRLLRVRRILRGVLDQDSGGNRST